MNLSPLAACILALVSPHGILPPHFAHAPMGPAHRATSLATTFELAADAEHVDVALLVALAKWESDFDKHAVSSAGAIGTMQLLPRWHRTTVGYCARHPELCEVAVINKGAQVLAHYKRRCKSDGRAIRAYRSGRCQQPTALTRKVLRTAAWIRRRLEEQ